MTDWTRNLSLHCMSAGASRCACIMTAAKFRTTKIRQGSTRSPLLVRVLRHTRWADLRVQVPNPVLHHVFVPCISIEYIMVTKSTWSHCVFAQQGDNRQCCYLVHGNASSLVQKIAAMEFKKGFTYSTGSKHSQWIPIAQLHILCRDFW